MFCRSKLREGNITQCFVAPSCRKEISRNVLSLQVAGRKYYAMFCRSKLQEGNITQCFVAPSCRKEISRNVLSLQVAGKKYLAMFCLSKLQERNISQCFVSPSCRKEILIDYSTKPSQFSMYKFIGCFLNFSFNLLPSNSF